MENAEIKRRYDVLRTNRHNIEGVWNYIERFIVPFRGRFFIEREGESEIDWRRREIFDSTAVIACQNLAANMHSALTNPSIRWFDLVFRDSNVNNIQEVKVWLEEVVERVHMSIQESNFNLEVNEAYLDLCSFGTALVVEEAEEDAVGGLKEIIFECMPLYQGYFEQDHRGDIVNLYRKLEWTPVEIISKFGEDGVPTIVKEKAESPGSITEKLVVVYSVFKREIGGEETGFEILAPENRAFGFKYVLYDSAETLGDEGGYYEMPVFAPRWRKTSGSMWGHSPAMICISDVLTINQLVEVILKAAEKVVDPPSLTTRRGVFGTIDLDAGGVTVVQSMDSIKPYISGARFDVSQLEKEELQKSIRSTFFMDQLQMKESPAMTATEVQVRFQLMQRLLGPTLGRLQSDFLDPLIERTFKILMRYKQLPELPDSVAQSASELDIEYLGSLAKSQKFEQVSSIERWLADLTNMAEKFPNVLDVVNADEVAKEIGMSLGVPAKTINSDTKINTTRMQRQQQQQQVQKIAQMQGAGDAMKSIGEGAQAIEEAGGAGELEGAMGGTA